VTRVAIFGLGRVGSLYDACNAGPPRSHVGAVLGTPHLRLSLLVDPDPEARERVRAQWGSRISNVPLVAQPDQVASPVDLAVIAAPSEDREAQVEAALALRPRVLVIEKPLAESVAVGFAIARQARDANAEIRVNFHRRFDPGFRHARSLLPGLPSSVVLRYGKGLFNYGGHLVDLLLDWFGPIDAVAAVGLESAVGPHSNLTFTCRMAAGFDATVIGLSGTNYDLLEGELYFPDRMLSFCAGGAQWSFFRPVDSLYYRGYAHLDEDRNQRAVGPVGGLPELYRAIAGHLCDGNPLPGCDITAAVAGLAVLEAALWSAREGGGPVIPSYRWDHPVTTRKAHS
jgi:predicted dehydrogenase